MSTVYNFEIWTSSGTIIADITPMCFSRQFTLTRNAAEQVSFSIDLAAFESYCQSINVAATTVLSPYQTDVRIKRNGTYILVAQITGLEFNFQPNDSGSGTSTGSFNKSTVLTETVTVTAVGYLNILNDRYYTGSLSNVDSAQVVTTLINATQGVTNGNFGLNTATATFTTGYSYSPTYSQQNILTEIGNLTQIPGYLFDVWIDPSKNVRMAYLQGNHRNDVQLTYGSAGSNIIGLYHQRTASGALYNEVIGLGSGFGKDALTSTQDNTSSQTSYYLRQKVMTYNNVINQTQLNNDVAGDLAMFSQMLEIPQIKITGGLFTGNTPFIGVGDRLPLNFPTHPLLANLSGQYFRLEQMQVQLDDNDFEFEITLTMDNYGNTAVGW